jgi:hypothetical protein
MQYQTDRAIERQHLSTQDYLDMSTGALVDTRSRLQLDCETIQHQLDMAIARAKDEGVYANAVWFAKAKLALRRKRRDVQQLNQLIRERREAERGKSQLALETAFVDLAREHLSPGLFEDLLHAAQRRAATT